MHGIATGWLSGPGPGGSAAAIDVAATLGQLAQQGQPSLEDEQLGRTFEILMLVGILVLAVLAIVAIALLVRRKLIESTDDSETSGLIEQMRRMREAGEISDEEWQAIRARLMNRMRDQMTGGSDAVTPQTGSNPGLAAGENDAPNESEFNDESDLSPPGNDENEPPDTPPDAPPKDEPDNRPPRGQ